jgi:predicted TIM-barrel fold metal-dependent hydrolase
MKITDSQVHIWADDSLERPWPQPLRSPPQMPHAYTAEAAVAQMDKAGVARAVIVPPIWAGDDNANLTATEACEAYPGRFAIMGRFDTDAPDAREKLEAFPGTPHMLGIRISGRPLAGNIESGSLDWLFAGCERLGIPLAMLLPRVDLLAGVVAKYPGLTVVLDHMAAALGQKGAAAFPMNAELAALARHPNLSVKVSSVAMMSADAYPFADVYEPLKAIYDSFGPQRMMWGTDITRGGAVSYEDLLRHFQEGLDFLTDDDKEWVLGKSLAKILNWPE